MSAILFFAEALSATATTLDTGAAFLKIDPSARSAALGGAYTASAGMADAAFFNPAGLASLPKKELMAGHASWLANTSYDTLVFGLPMKQATLAFGAIRLSEGSIDARGADRTSAGSFTAEDAAYGLSMARSFDGFAAGGTFKLLRSQIAQYTAQTEAVDLGVRKSIPGKPLSLGFAVRNLGPGQKFLDQRDPLPLMVSAGATWHLGGVLGLAFDVREEPYDKRLSFAMGTEYAFLGALAIRAGYGQSSLQRATGQSPLTGLGAGLGLRIRSFGADYAFTPFGELGDVQRLNLSVRF